TENGASASPSTEINRYDVSDVSAVVTGVMIGVTMPPRDFGASEMDTLDESAAYTYGSSTRNSAVMSAAPCCMCVEPGAGGATRPGRPHTTRSLSATLTRSGARRPGPSRSPRRHAPRNRDTAPLADASSRYCGLVHNVNVNDPDYKYPTPGREPCLNGHSTSPVRKSPRSSSTSVKNKSFDVSPTVTPSQETNTRSPPHRSITTAPRLRSALRPHKRIHQLLRLIVRRRHIIDDLRTIALGTNRTIRNLTNRPPLRVSQHSFRLASLINRQLPRIMPTALIVQEWLHQAAIGVTARPVPASTKGRIPRLRVMNRRQHVRERVPNIIRSPRIPVRIERRLDNLHQSFRRRAPT